MSTVGKPAARLDERPALRHESRESADTALVVDDERFFLTILGDFLTQHLHMRPVLVQDGEAALSLLETETIDLVLLDILMPGMDGWSVLSQLKAMPGFADIPIILLTMLDNKEMGFALGAADYLTKPIDAQKLLPVLDRHRSPKQAGTVLVVEDDPASRELVVRMLEKESIVVKEATNGKEALDIIQGGVMPDMIILDLVMTEMDGFEFLRQIHPHPEWSKIPVVVMSSLDLNPETQQALKGQVERIFQKGSFAREDLLREVRETINQHMLKRQPGSVPAAVESS